MATDLQSVFVACTQATTAVSVLSDVRYYAACGAAAVVGALAVVALIALRRRRASRAAEEDVAARARSAGMWAANSADESAAEPLLPAHTGGEQDGLGGKAGGTNGAARGAGDPSVGSFFVSAEDLGLNGGGGGTEDSGGLAGRRGVTEA
jgi:hypothetical protein